MNLPALLSLDAWMELRFKTTYEVYSNLYEKAKEIERERDDLKDASIETDTAGGGK